jgi:hypothetical protein
MDLAMSQPKGLPLWAILEETHQQNNAANFLGSVLTGLATAHRTFHWQLY